MPNQRGSGEWAETAAYIDVSEHGWLGARIRGSMALGSGRFASLWELSGLCENLLVDGLAQPKARTQTQIVEQGFDRTDKPPAFTE